MMDSHLQTDMLEVVCAIILDKDSRVFVARRKPGKMFGHKWEFPGGKVEKGEAPAEALIREIQEELGITVIPTEELTSSVHEEGGLVIRLTPFLCEAGAIPTHSNDHDELRWLLPEELPSLDWAPADIPIMREVISHSHKI